MDVTVIANPGAPHQLEHQRALIKGLTAHGVTAIASSASVAKTKAVACWGWYKGRRLRAAGHDVLVMERGYLGDRFSWTSLAWNGLNGRAHFPPAPADPGRFSQNFDLQPWRYDGDYVLIMGQVPGDASLQGRDLYPWYMETKKLAAERYGLPVKFRAHPLGARRGGRIPPGATTGTLEEDLAGAAVVITFNSNSGVDAVVRGIPTVAVDRGSMAWDVTAHEIGDMVRPDREQWAAELAWRQWTIDEIRDGSALGGVLEAANG